jgi:tetratricopeptide (TPR) repeat protein
LRWSVRARFSSRCPIGFPPCHAANAAIKRDQNDDAAAAQILEDAEKILRALVEQYGPTTHYGQRESDTLRDLAGVEQSLQKPQQALDHLRSAAALTQKFIDLYRKDKELAPELAQSLQDLAAIYTQAGDAKQADAALAEAVEILSRLVKQFPDDPQFQSQLDAVKKMAAAAPRS